jgi:hypothetical protein
LPCLGRLKVMRATGPSMAKVSVRQVGSPGSRASGPAVVLMLITPRHAVYCVI